MEYYHFCVFLEYLINLFSSHEAVVEIHKFVFIENLSLLFPVAAFVILLSVGLIEQFLQLVIANLDIESFTQLLDFFEAQESTFVGISFLELFTQEPDVI